MIFDESALREFLSYAAQLPVCRFRDWKGGPSLLLRHDLDLDLSAALRFAELEVQHELCATYFVRTTAPSYNVTSKPNRERLQRLASLNFEIGLHFDPSIYESTSDKDLYPKVKAEAAILEDITGNSVASISIHEPSVHGQYPLFDGYVNAYDPVLFEGRYLSDSRMQFQEDVYKFCERAKSETVQLLLHPLHFSALKGDYRSIFGRFSSDFLSDVDIAFSPNSVYRSAFPEGLTGLLGQPVAKE